MSTTGANVKMGVSGVSQFKQSMNQAKQAVKTLDAQLALSEKQFKQTGDSQGYMAEKSALLDAKLENQKKVLENAQKALEDMAAKGVDRSSKAYQDMYRTMLEAKGAIIDTENAMNGVVDAGDAASDGVSEMNNQLKQIGKGVSYDNVTNGIGKITGAMEKAMAKAVQLGKKIVNEVLGAGSWADDLQTRASHYGLSPEQLQRMDKTSRLIDTSTDAILNAQKKLKKGLGTADKDVMGAYAELLGEGYDPKSKGWEQAFWDAGEAIMRFTDEEEKEVYAQRLFGRSWNELIPLFEAGKEKYEEMNASWNVVSQDNIDKLQAMQDQYDKLQNEFETVKNTFLASMAPALESVMKTITDLLEKFNEYLASPEGKEAMQKLGDTISALVEDLVNVDPDAVVNGIVKAIDGIVSALNWIRENKDFVVRALEAIGIAFAGLKLGEMAINVKKVVDGFKQINGGGNGGTPSTNGGNGSPSTNGGSDAVKGGGGALGAKALIAKLSGFAGYASEMLLGALPVLGVGATFAATIVANNAARDAAEAKYGEMVQRAEEAASQIDRDTSMELKIIESLSGAMGYQKDSKGRYVTGWFGTKQFGDWGIIGKSAEEFAGLRNEQQAKLYNMIRQYSPYTTGGWDTIKMLDKVRAGTAEQWEKQEVLMAIQEAYTKALENEAVTQSIDRMSQTAEDLSGNGVPAIQNAGKDISDAAKDMGKLPKETAVAVQDALNGAQVVIDGASLTAVVGQVMAGVLADFRV